MYACMKSHIFKSLCLCMNTWITTKYCATVTKIQKGREKKTAFHGKAFSCTLQLHNLSVHHVEPPPFVSSHYFSVQFHYRLSWAHTRSMCVDVICIYHIRWQCHSKKSVFSPAKETAHTHKQLNIMWHTIWDADDERLTHISHHTHRLNRAKFLPHISSFIPFVIHLVRLLVWSFSFLLLILLFLTTVMPFACRPHSAQMLHGKYIRVLCSYCYCVSVCVCFGMNRKNKYHWTVKIKCLYYY